MPGGSPGARRQIRPQRAAELVAADIRSRILLGELDEGLPTETVLLEEFSVSRPTIDIAAYHLGLVLQGGAVELTDLAAARPDRDTVAAQLHALVDESEALIDDGAAFTTSLLRFHEALVAACQNSTLRILVGTVERVWESQERAWAREATGRGEYPDVDARRHAIESHRRIADKVASGDGEAAARASRKHLAASMSYVCGTFTADPPQEPRTAEHAHVIDATLLRI